MTPLIAALVTEARALAKILDQTSSAGQKLGQDLVFAKQKRHARRKTEPGRPAALSAFDQES